MLKLNRAAIENQASGGARATMPSLLWDPHLKRETQAGLLELAGRASSYLLPSRAVEGG